MNLNKKTDRIKELEKTIVRSFIDVGKELILISEKELYKSKYRVFNEYVDKEFSFNHSQAHKFMKIAKEYPSLDSENPVTGLGIEKLYLLSFVPKMERDVMIEEIAKEPTIPKIEEIKEKVKRFNVLPFNNEKEPETELMQLRRKTISMITILEGTRDYIEQTLEKVKAHFEVTEKFQELDRERDIMVKVKHEIKDLINNY